MPVEKVNLYVSRTISVEQLFLYIVVCTIPYLHITFIVQSQLIVT